MAWVRTCIIVGVLAVLLCSCGLLPPEEGTEGYLLRSEEEGPGAGTLFVRYENGTQPGTLTGYMYFAYPAENPEGAYLETQRITGSVDGPRVLLQLEGNPQAEYVGTVEEGSMELQNGLASWEGEIATFEDFGEAAEEMTKASMEGDFTD